MQDCFALRARGALGGRVLIYKLLLRKKWVADIPFRQPFATSNYLAVCPPLAPFPPSLLTERGSQINFKMP
jgi:hypothetical protein